MVKIKLGDEGPKVVLAQIALSTRPPQSPLRVDGKFGEKTTAAVRLLQKSLFKPQTGVIEGPEWQAMMSSMPFITFDHADIDETIVALMAGKSDEEIARDSHQYGIVAMAELSRAGSPVSSIGVGVSNGVGQLISRIIRAGSPTRIGLLRIYGHGAKGLQMLTAGRGGMPGGAGEHAAALTPTITRRFRLDFKRAAASFQPYGSAELHGCRVGDGPTGRLLLKDLAEEWGVPVTAGIHKQHVGRGATFRFEGPTVTAYPGKGNLRSWAEKMAQLSAFSRA